MSKIVPRHELPLYDVDLAYVDAERVSAAVGMCVTSEAFKKEAASRVELFARLKEANEKGDRKRVQQYVKAIQAKDLAMEKTIYTVVANCCMVCDSRETPENVTFKSLFAGLPEDKIEEGMRLSEKLDCLTFVADFCETLLLDIKTRTTRLFGEEIHFRQFDDVEECYKRIRKNLKQTRDTYESFEEGQLFADTADSIEAYLLKRMATYHKREQALKEKIEKELAKSKENKSV